MPDDPLAPPTRAVLVELRVAPPGAVLSLAGELDLHTVAQLQAILEAILAAPVSRVDIDLAAVEFASMSALGHLVAVADRLDERDGCLVLHGSSPLQERVLGLLGAPGTLVVERSVDG